MDINKAFRFVFDDKQWVSKLLIGVLMSILGFFILPALILQGYVVKIVRQVMGGQDNDLPEWTDYGKLLRDGFFVAVAEFVYVLPFILLFIIVGLATGGLGSMTGSDDFAAAAVTGGGLLILCLALLMIVALLLIMPALIIRYAITDDFGSLFQFGEVIALARNHISDILMVFLVSVVATFAIGVVGSILGIIPCLGWIAAFVIGAAMTPYIQFVTGHLYGQIARKVPGNKAGGAGYYPPMA